MSGEISANDCSGLQDLAKQFPKSIEIDGTRTVFRDLDDLLDAVERCREMKQPKITSVKCVIKRSEPKCGRARW